MKNRAMAALVCFALALLLCACGADGGGRTGEETLYNGYLGLTVMVPEGWLIEEKNEVNLTATPEESGKLESMDLEPYTDGGAYAGLIALQNTGNPEDDGHIAMKLSAERYQNQFPALEEYVYACELSATTGRADGLSGELVDRQAVSFAGGRFTRLTVAVSGAEAFVEEYYIAKREGLYLAAYLNYRGGSSQMTAARAALESLFRMAGTAVDAPAGRESTYHNGYLALTVTVPGDRYVVEVNRTNMTAAPENSRKLEDLEKGSYNDGGYYLDLISLRTAADSAADDYAEFDLYAEGYPIYGSLDEYLDAMVEAFTADEAARVRRALVSRDTADLGGRGYARIVTTSVDADTGLTLREEHYVAQVNELYVVAYVGYKDNAQARANAEEMLALFAL